MLNVIRQWVIKTMMKNNTGVVQTLPKRDLIELNTQITAQRLMQNGVDPQALKNVNQVENAVNAIESRPPVQQGIRSTKSAKVMDMEGKEIKDPKNIMGGKEINQQTLNEELMKKDNPYSDLVNTPRPKTLKEREAEVLAAMEKNNKEAAQRIRNRKMLDDAVDNASPGFVKGDRKYNAQLVADDLAEKKFGKDFYDLDQKQQMDLYGEALDGLDDSRFKNKPDPEDMAQGGRAGYKFGIGPLLKRLSQKSPKKAYTDYLESVKKRAQEGDMKSLAPELGAVTATGVFINRRMKDVLENMKEKDMENNLKNFRKELEQDDFYKERPELKDKILENYTEKMFGEKRADGGRIGLKAGMTKRAFLKLMGTGAAGIAALKSGVLGLGKGVGKKAVEKVAINSSTLSAPPPYFFELANKIKMLGKPDKVTYADRVEIHRYRGKNGDEYELIEDLNTGDVRITKDKTGVGSYGDKTFDTIEDRTVLDYRKGDVNVKDEGLETQKSFKEADEYEEYKVEFDADGTEAGADDIAANVQKEIIEEAGGEAPSIKKAGGGIARMLGE